MCACGLDALRAYDDAVTDHDRNRWLGRIQRPRQTRGRGPGRPTSRDYHKLQALWAHPLTTRLESWPHHGRGSVWVGMRGHVPLYPPWRNGVDLDGMRGTIIVVKATVDIRDELLAQARAQAARERTTLAAVVEEGLVLRLSSAAPRGGAMNPLPVSPRRGGLRSGIDGSCNRSLLDAADPVIPDASR